jgi:hypothetical protein
MDLKLLKVLLIFQDEKKGVCVCFRFSLIFLIWKWTPLSQIFCQDTQSLSYLIYPKHSMDCLLNIMIAFLSNLLTYSKIGCILRYILVDNIQYIMLSQKRKSIDSDLTRIGYTVNFSLLKLDREQISHHSTWLVTGNNICIW